MIQTPSGSDLVPVDQRSNGGTWQLLGTFALEAGTGNSVILNADLADGLAIADAVRITRAVNLGDTAYIHTDHLGTPQKMTDAGGAVIWDRVARPFGATESESGSLATDLRFPGQLFDAESGLHYNTFRDYDPTLGRYIQSDPIGLNGGLNTYGYAYQNSVRYIDPTGKNPLALAYYLAQVCARNPACATGALATAKVVGDYLSAMMGQDYPGEDSERESDSYAEEYCADDDYDDEFCEKQYEDEEKECYYNWGNFKPGSGETNFMLQGCLSKAASRLAWCRTHNGNMSGAPSKWSDRDVDGWPTIHDK